MPQLGETVTEGTIIRWAKQVGDAVDADEVLFEVSTDKVDTEVPSAHAGVVRELLVPEGATVPIGTVVAVLTATADEPYDSEPVPARTPPPAAAARRGERPGRTVPSEVFLSPVVRGLLDEHGLRPVDVVGTGAGGRITRADVLAAAANRSRDVSRGPSSPSAAPGAAAAPYPPAVPADGDEIVEFTRARRNTAEHMVRSQATSAHTLVGVSVDYHRIERVRRERRLSYLPFVVRAVVEGLRAFPHLNASVGDDCLLVHRDVNIGVAVDVDFEALVVPVVKGADGLHLAALQERIAALAATARAKRLTTDDLSGGTFTITNVGQYGTVVTFPVINQPQVAILSTDGVRMAPVAVPDGHGGWSVAVHPVGNLSLGFDHRAVDGAYAAAFLARVRDTLEQRDWAQER